MENLDTDLLVSEAQENLLQMAEAADAERSPGQPEVAEKQEVAQPVGEQKAEVPPVTTTEKEKPPVSSETEPETAQAKEQRLRDEKGRFQAKEKEQQKLVESQKPAEQQQGSDYDRAKKEAERRDRSWQALEAEKEQVRAEKARIDEINHRAQLEQQGAPLPPVLKDGYSAQDYWQAYQDFKRNGDHENAAKALEAVYEINAYTQNAVQQRQAAAIELAFTQDRDRVIAKQPDLADMNKPISQEVMKVLNEFPEVYFLPKGFERATQLAQLRLDAGSVSELRDENIKLRAELERRDKLSTPAKGGPTAPAKDRSLDDMNPEERFEALMSKAEYADSFAGAT